MAKLTKGESRWQNVTLGYEKWLWVVIIEKETFKYRLQVHWKNVEVYIADTNKYITLIPMPFDVGECVVDLSQCMPFGNGQRTRL